jgi:hypothetical protein
MSYDARMGATPAVLDNVFWNALSGAHAPLSEGNARARRYARGLPAIAAFPDPQHPDFETLATLFEPGEPFYTSGWSGAAPGSRGCHRRASWPRHRRANGSRRWARLRRDSKRRRPRRRSRRA